MRNKYSYSVWVRVKALSVVLFGLSVLLGSFLLVTISKTAQSQNESSSNTLRISRPQDGVDRDLLSFNIRNKFGIMKTVFGVERNIEDDSFPTEDEINELESILPDGCIHGWFPSTYQNKQLHYRKWIPSNPKAIVIFMHGISTHSAKYVNLIPSMDSDVNGTSSRIVSTSLMIDTFMKHNISVYAFDQYGHGYSEGFRFLIPESYSINVQDYINFTYLVASENKAGILPMFLMCESYGCTVTLHATKYFQDQSEPEKKLQELDSMILTAPAIIGDLPIYPVVLLLQLLGRFFPIWRPFFVPNPVSPDRIWRDPFVLEFYLNKTNPATIVDGSGLPFRLGTVVQLIRATEDVRETIIPKLTTPYIVIHGTEDYSVPISGSEYLYENSLTSSDNKEFIKLDKAYHDLLADPAAEICMGNIVDWINQRIALRAGGT